MILFVEQKGKPAKSGSEGVACNYPSVSTLTYY